MVLMRGKLIIGSAIIGILVLSGIALANQYAIHWIDRGQVVSEKLVDVDFASWGTWELRVNTEHHGTITATTICERHEIGSIIYVTEFGHGIDQTDETGSYNGSLC